MESTNSNSNQMLFLCELKELRNELSAVKKRIVQLEESHEKQQEKIDILERENHALKIQLNINGNKEDGSILKRKRTDQDHEKDTESKTTSDSVLASKGKKKTKTNNNNDDDEAVLLPKYDNWDSFDSLSDDLLHKIVEFNGNCYSKFGLINKRCKNIYDVKEYKLKKVTCLFGYGTIEMMLQHYLQKRREGSLDDFRIAAVVLWYNRLDAIDWIIQLGDKGLLERVCSIAAYYGRINILSKVFLKLNVAMLDELLDDGFLSDNAARSGQLETLKWLRNLGAKWDADTLAGARDEGHDDIVQYLRAEGCPEQQENTDESSSESEQDGSDDEDGDY